MGTFAETAIIVYGLSFGYQEKKLPFSVSVCSKRMEVHRFRFRLQQKTEVAVFRLQNSGNMEK
jgi:hypothetical protein